MKKIILSVLMLLLFQTNLFSESENTNERRNGNFWVSLDDTSRLYYSIGFNEGSDSI